MWPWTQFLFPIFYTCDGVWWTWRRYRRTHKHTPRVLIAKRCTTTSIGMKKMSTVDVKEKWKISIWWHLNLLYSQHNQTDHCDLLCICASTCVSVCWSFISGDLLKSLPAIKYDYEEIFFNETNLFLIYHFLHLIKWMFQSHLIPRLHLIVLFRFVKDLRTR